MKNNVYNRQGIDLWRLTLVMAGKLWILLLAVISGCILGAAVYKIYTAVKYPVAEYRISSDYYITFNFDEFEHGDDYYNAYTWDGILRDDPLTEYALSVLPGDITKDMIKEAVTGEMLGDYRILTVHVTGKNQEYVKYIANAYKEAMIHFGEEIPLFEKIELWSMEEPVVVRKDTKIMNAAFLGGLLAFLLAAFILLYYYLLLDAFYTESDLWQRFGERRMLLDENNGQKITKEQIKEADVTPEFKVFGIQTKKEDREEEGILTANLKLALGEKEVYLLWDGTVFPEDKDWDKLKKRPVVLTVPFGKNVGRRVDRILAYLQQNGCYVAGCILTDADDRFLSLYYGKAWRK